MTVVSVDPGLRSLGFVEWDAESGLTDWGHTAVCPGKITGASAAAGFSTWLTSHRERLERALYIVVENQFPASFETALCYSQMMTLMVLYGRKVKIVYAKDVKKHFELPDNRRDKKARAVELLLEDWLPFFDSFDGTERIHDIADAWLNCKYFVESNQKA